MRGLSSRDEVLLRFYLSIARDQTDHAWKFSTESPADLLILGPDTKATQSSQSGRERVPVTIRVQHEGAAQPGELTMPFKADELVRAVNAAGAAAQLSTSSSAMATAAVAAMLSRARTSSAPAEGSTVPAVASRPETMQIARSQRIALKRWPDAALLAAGSWNVKLAAILTGRPISVPDLAARSGAPEETCAAFVHALLARNFASLVPATLSGAGAPMAFDAAKDAGEARGSGAPVAAPASQGLIARIRARLRL